MDTGHNMLKTASPGSVGAVQQKSRWWDAWPTIGIGVLIIALGIWNFLNSPTSQRFVCQGGRCMLYEQKRFDSEKVKWSCLASDIQRVYVYSSSGTTTGTKKHHHLLIDVPERILEVSDTGTLEETEKRRDLINDFRDGRQARLEFVWDNTVPNLVLDIFLCVIGLGFILLSPLVCAWKRRHPEDLENDRVRRVQRQQAMQSLTQFSEEYLKRHNRKYAILAWFLCFWILSLCSLFFCPLFFAAPTPTLLRFISIAGWWWLFLTGCMILFAAVNQMITAWRSRSWLMTEGRVREYKVGSTRARPEDGGPDPTMIQYEYTVDGKTYIGGDAILGPGMGYAPDSLIDAYAPGSLVFVYYDPKKPWKSKTLSQGVRPGRWIGLAILGLIWIATCLGILLGAGGIPNIKDFM